MNPASVSAAPTAPSSPVSVGPADIVNNIPVHAPTGATAAADEDTELDQIMQDVGHELKKDDKKPKKHGFLHFGHKTKKDAPFSAQAVRQTAVAFNRAPATKHDVRPPVPAAPAMQPVAVPLNPAPVQARPTGSPAAQAKPPAAVQAPARPKTSRQIPVFVIFVTILATGFLIAAAIAAYRPQ